jgi:uncharacterized protein CbrC (UPF0167 family)
MDSKTANKEFMPFVFRCHPDPLATGAIQSSDTSCACCGQSTGHIYTGPSYGSEDYVDCICPGCIADGSAHQKLAVEFTDPGAVGGYGQWQAVPQAVVEEIAFRTPAFLSWQQGQWYTCCEDAAAFLGGMGYAELNRYGSQAVEAIRLACVDFEDGKDSFLKSLKKNGSPTAYLFKCLHCGKYGGYVDYD